ncbi:MAG: hypothetical protein NC936_04080 [Candidatus Omnitrophica bacterium]|nr:hypothetical protein [Candidatus Omnitrophota bacterium]
MRGMLSFILILAFIFSYVPVGFAGTEEEVAALKEQVKTLMQRIETLEKELAKTKEEQEKVKIAVTPSRVDLSNALSTLKIKGRFAAGYFDSGKAGSYPSGSFEAPEGKIQFAFQPDEINTVIMRFNLNNATAQSPLLDYFYLQSKDFLPFLKDTPFSLSSRLGRFKLGFGEETWSDNPVEGVLPSNSAPKTGGNDEGLELAGKIKLDKIGLRPLGWVASISDGNSGVGSDTSGGKAFMGKLYYSPIDSLYLSASYYNSGSLKRSASELSIAGLTSVPSGSTDWKRKVWELDCRYDFGKGKKPLDPPAFSDSKAFVRLSYGRFQDDVQGASTVERAGDFGFVEGTYNLTKKFYTAGRYSWVDLDGNITASLNSVTANKYERYSLGFGYRWSENTILKLSYDWNDESGVEDVDNNLISAIIASQF